MRRHGVSCAAGGCGDGGHGLPIPASIPRPYRNMKCSGGYASSMHYCKPPATGCVGAGTTMLLYSGKKSGTERSEEPTSDLQSLMRPSYAVFCLKKQIYAIIHVPSTHVSSVPTTPTT